jgi:hypothetical protein
LIKKSKKHQHHQLLNYKKKENKIGSSAPRGFWTRGGGGQRERDPVLP